MQGANRLGLRLRPAPLGAKAQMGLLADDTTCPLLHAGAAGQPGGDLQSFLPCPPPHTQSRYTGGLPADTWVSTSQPQVRVPAMPISHQGGLCLFPGAPSWNWHLPLTPPASPPGSHPEDSQEGCLWSLPPLEWTLLVETGGWTWGRGYVSDASSIDL